MPFELSSAPVHPSRWLRRVCSSFEPGMGKGQLGAFWYGAQIEGQMRFARVLAPCPAPGDCQPPGLFHLEIFAAAFMFTAVEPAETSPESAARVLLGFGQQHRRASGPHQWLMPSDVIRAAKTREGRALILRTRTSEVIAGA